MPKTRLISPGSIPNHRLLKNLQLDDNYLTNDGGTEGISINDDGNVTVTGTYGSGDAYLYIRQSVSQQCYLKMGSAGYEDYAQIQVDHASTGDMVFWTANTEKLRIRGNGNVGIGTSTPISKLEILNTNVQYSTGTAIQVDATIAGSGTTFTADMVGGRFIFDDGTDAGIVTGFTGTTVLTVSTSQTVGSSPGDFRSFKIYYPSVRVDTSGNSSSLKIGNMTIDNDEIDLGTGGSITIDAGDDIALSADGGNITMNDGTTTIFDFDVDNVSLKIMDDADTGDYFSITTIANGATTFTTVDDDGDNAHLVVNIDGYININPESYIKISGENFWLNMDTKTASGTGDSSVYIEETLDLSSGASGTDVHHGIRYDQTQTNLAGWDSVYLMHLSGGAGKILSVDNNANVALSNDRKVIFGDAGEYIVGDGTDLDIASSNHLTLTCGVNLAINASGNVQFDGCGVGFDLETPTYNASDTDVNFINGNKQFVTFGAGNITDLNLIFPKVSGNFLLMLKQDGTGSRTVTNYKVWDRADSQAASGSATVKFAGGSNPDLTDDANHVDILSFFYDADNEIAYGVATLDFQF